jgi:hypothetical protein
MMIGPRLGSKVLLRRCGGGGGSTSPAAAAVLSSSVRGLAAAAAAAASAAMPGKAETNLTGYVCEWNGMMGVNFDKERTNERPGC